MEIKKWCAAFALSAVALAGCSSEADTYSNVTNVTGLSVPASMQLGADGVMTLGGNGVVTTDNVALDPAEAGNSYTAPVTRASEAGSFQATAPAGFESGRYKFSLVRGDERIAFGQSDVTAGDIKFDIPDREGMTIKGVVHCGTQRLAGVVVSDGYEVVKTDENGVYYLPSKKKDGYVFISLPSNYEVATANGNEPQFFKRVTAGSTAVEQADFNLKHVDNSRHKLLLMADFHLANRTNDLAQYAQFVNDANQTISEEQADGSRVYGLTLGDLSWDLYWYSKKFALPEYMKEVNKIKCPTFNTIGNHDNDPYIANDDWKAADAFRRFVCPNYYSFNLGGVHYIVLDDIRYINTGAADGKVGERNYDGVVVDYQMDWLRKDLAMITDKQTPIVIALHIPINEMRGLEKPEVTLQNGEELVKAFEGFKDVTFLSGHIHVGYNVEREGYTEHNIPAVCATWWWTGQLVGNHICKDGAPGGYAVRSVDNGKASWYYKGTGFPKDYQFRTYDLNNVEITAAKFAPNTTDEKLAPYTRGYEKKRTDNEVLINVFDYDKAWKVEVTENGKSLPVERIYGYDPLHIISYDVPRLNQNATPTGAFTTEPTDHLFKVKASSPTSTLTVKVTDRFGKVYTEEMKRPKAFNTNMR